MKTSRVAVLGLLVVAVGVAAARAGDLGYDPRSDPAADLAATVERAQTRGTRILVVVGGDWCSWCHVLDRFVEENEEIHRLWESHFETLKVHRDPETPNADFLGQYPEIPGYPHIFVLEGDGSFLHSQGTAELEEGRSYSPERMREFLTRWANEPD